MVYPAGYTQYSSMLPPLMRGNARCGLSLTRLDYAGSCRRTQHAYSRPLNLVERLKVRRMMAAGTLADGLNAVRTAMTNI